MAARATSRKPSSKLAGGGYDASYNAQTAVDEAAHIIVAAELTNNASDAGELPTMLHAVRNNLGQMPQHRSPRTAQMAAKLQTDEGKAAYRRRKWIAEPAQRLGEERAGVPAVQHERAAPRASRVEALVCMALNLRRMCTLQAV